MNPVRWNTNADPKPVAMSVLYRFRDTETGEYAYGVADVINSFPDKLRRAPLEWLPLSIFDAQLYVGSVEPVQVDVLASMIGPDDAAIARGEHVHEWEYSNYGRSCKACGKYESD